MSKMMLFSPGPVMTRQNVRESLMHYDICHRSREFEEMYAGLCAKINKIFGADDTYRSVVISGSGTSANETVISSVLKEGDTVLYGKYAGTEIEVDGAKLLMMRQSDILAIVE